MSHSKRERSRLMGRVNRLLGQLESVRGLLEREDYDAAICHDVMALLASIKGASRGLTEAFLEGYVMDHMLKDGRRLHPRDVNEFMEVIKKFRA